MVRGSVLVLLAALVLSVVARAEPVADLYRGEAIITGRENLPERARGLREALAHVVIKVSGDSRLADDPRLTPWLNRAGDLARGWTHEDRLAKKKLMDEQGTRDRSYYFRVQFDPASVDAILAEMGAVPWAADRPRVLVRLDITDLRGTYRLAQDSERGFGQRAAFESAQHWLGLPAFVLPVGGAEPGFDVVLQGDMRMTPQGYWNTLWTLPNGETLTVTDLPFDKAIRQGAAALARSLAGRR